MNAQRYIVKVTETITHEVEVEADSEETATELALGMVSGDKDETLLDYLYSVDSLDWEYSKTAELVEED